MHIVDKFGRYVDNLSPDMCLKRGGDSAKKTVKTAGLDTDMNKIPHFLLETTDPIFAFNKEIIDATQEFTVVYKPNMAFYESMGVSGWNSLEKTVNYIRYNYPDIFIIADAKRGDIGNTSNM